MVKFSAKAFTIAGTSNQANCDGRSVKIEGLLEGTQLILGMLVYSAQIRDVLASVKRFAPHKTSVLIRGESGTGKELVARSLHSLGTVPNGPFITFNCSNLIESLADAQLFGHVKGAFTDARVDSLGYFRSANGGTLFLDEVGELPLNLQPKLLRAVETHEVQPVGSPHAYKVDIKLVSATNCDLNSMVKSGGFRSDLYYRLNAAVILIPPLRERQSAIGPLIGHFVQHYNHLLGKNISTISQNALETMCCHSWPGNIRELAHAIESAMLMAEGNEIRSNDLPLLTSDGPASNELIAPTHLAEVNEAAAEEQRSFSLELALNDASKKALVRALEASGGNGQKAAGLLGTSRFTVSRMIARHRLLPLRDHHNLVNRQKQTEETLFKAERDTYWLSREYREKSSIDR